MKLYEYQGREVFERFGIPTPGGVVVSSLEELERVKDELKFPLVVKAQVLVGGRGKAGGVKFADDYEEAKRLVDEILGMDIKGLTVNKVFLVEKLDFAQELYASVVLDRSTRQALIMVSAEGGVDIESVPDEQIFKVNVNPLVGYRAYHTLNLVKRLGVTRDQAKQVGNILARLTDAFFEMDAELMEINPLAITGTGDVVAADAKVVINDSALFRHEDVERTTEELSPLEEEANEKGIAFVKLEGDIGVIANGAGLTMATLDAIKHYGGDGGVFLDLGGTDSPEKVKECFLLMREANPSVVLLNLFGGITKCDTVARGVKEVLDTTDIDFPIVTRIKGVNEEEAREILKDAGLATAQTLQEAAQMTIEAEAKTNGGA